MTTAVKERPILFSGPMVCAILEGRKTQTRRVVRDQPTNAVSAAMPSPDTLDLLDSQGRYVLGTVSPYGQPGGRLWVREFIQYRVEHANYYYAADNKGVGEALFNKIADKQKGKPKSIPSIHMWRWASRITLEVTDVRVERLQTISQEDAKAEGINPVLGDMYGDARDEEHIRHPGGFQWLWDSINAKRGYSWESNPWVWTVTFQRVE